MPTSRSRTSPTLALASLAASLLVVNAAFILWPSRAPDPRVFAAPAAPEQVVLEMVDVTEQPPPPADLPPPPPPDLDLPPEEVPDEVVVEEIVEDLPIRLPPVPTPRTSPRSVPAPPGPVAPPPPAPAPPPPSTRIVERPDRSPSLVTMAIPVYPPDARGARARVRVRVLVSEGGRPLDAEIVERAVLDGDDERPVPSLPAGMEEAAIEAAHRHVFRPARDEGDRVRAYAFITLSFDPPR